MKVLIVSGGFPTEKDPLNGNFEYDQAVALSSLGVEVYYFAVDLRSIRRRRHWGTSFGERDGIKWSIISIPLGPIPQKYFCGIGRWALRHLYKKVFSESLKPDIIHAHFMQMGYMSSFLSKEFGIPLVITEHSSEINKPVLPEEIAHYARIGYEQAKVVIAVGNRLRNNIKKTIGIDCVVIPNMLRLSVFESVKKVQHKGFRIVTTAIQYPGKRTILLIEALERIKCKYSDVYLDIIGDGPMIEKLKDAVVEYGLNDNVTFHGYLRDYEIANVYSNSDCFALVSQSETFGVVYIEAMAAGLPVIATRCGGPEDFVSEQNGVLIDVDHIDQLVDAIDFLKNNLYRYNITEMKKMVEEMYSPTIIAQRLLEQYKCYFS